MLNSILIDSGPLIALFDQDDKYNKRIAAFIRDKSWRLVTTSAVVAEVSHMLNFNVLTQINFFEWILRRGLLIEDIKQQDIGRVIELTRKYKDLPMDFADCTLVIAAEKTGIRSIISIDSDFDVYRLPGKVRIENVFREG
ncbi:pilus biogenesis protein [Spirochaetia bacterium]|nr:pilus biogenesis protein [Spirochaetia bacterium]GHV86740.1 pilus biogenesis protein [Spirochaetia bacterium]